MNKEISDLKRDKEILRECAILYRATQNDKLDIVLDAIYIRNVLTTPWYSDEKYKKRTVNKYLKLQKKVRYFVSVPKQNNLKIIWLCPTKQSAVECIYFSQYYDHSIHHFLSKKRNIERCIEMDRLSISKCIVTKIKGA